MTWKDLSVDHVRVMYSCGVPAVVDRDISTLLCRRIVINRQSRRSRQDIPIRYCGCTVIVPHPHTRDHRCPEAN